MRENEADAKFGIPIASFWVENVDLEEANSYVYLSKEINVRHNPQKEIVKELAGFCSIIDGLKALDPEDRVRPFNTTVLQAVTMDVKRGHGGR